MLADGVRARLDAVLAAHARAQGINPRDHGVVAIADLTALLAAYDALLIAQAQAAPVLAMSDTYERAKDLEHGLVRAQARDAWVAAVRAWRAAREG